MGYDKFEGLNQITDAYQKAVAKTILQNELGYKEQTTGYELTHSTGISGWSFGGYQLDISQRKEEGIALLKDIFTNQYGQNSWTASIEVALKSTNKYLLSPSDKVKIDNALSSSYGKEILNKDFINELTKVTNHIDKIEIELQKIKPDLRLSDGEKLMLADFHNQYNLGFNTTQSNSMLKKIEDYIELKGDITPEGLKDLFKTTDQYKNNKTSQEPRIQRSYEAAKELDA